MCESVGRPVTDGELALDLWRRWFHLFGQPWITVDDGCYCLFCDGEDEQHEANCVYVLAKDLVTRVSSTPAPEFAHDI